MRSRFAILLLALFSFALLSPVFGGAADANLPACCRHRGKHHCSMPTDSDASQSAPAFTSNAKCPLYPGIALYPGNSIAAQVARTISLPFTDNWQALSAHYLRTGEHSLRATAHYKRGPPTSFSV
jgi:hypothetical protein